LVRIGVNAALGIADPHLTQQRDDALVEGAAPQSRCSDSVSADLLPTVIAG